MGIVIGTITTSASTSLTLDMDALATRVAKLLRRDDIDTEIQQWINFAQRELCDRVPFSELRDEVYTTLVPNQYTYTLPTDYSREDKIFYLDDTVSPSWGRTLQALPRKMYETLGLEKLMESSSPTTGDPMYYLIQGTDIYLYPVPSKASRLELQYYKLPTDMTLGTHAPSIDNRWRHYLVYLAYYWGMIFLEKEDPNKLLLWERKFDKTVNMVKSLVLRRENRVLRFVTPSFGLEHASKIY